MMAQQGKPVVSNLRVFEFEDIASNEKAVIQHAIEVSNSNKRQAAIMLKMSRATLYNKLKKYGIDTNH